MRVKCFALATTAICLYFVSFFFPCFLCSFWVWFYLIFLYLVVCVPLHVDVLCGLHKVCSHIIARSGSFIGPRESSACHVIMILL